MKLFGKLALTMVAALALIGLTTSAASAVTVRPGGNITATSLGRLVLSGAIDISCNVSLAGTLRTSGTVGSVVGQITGGSANPCDPSLGVTLDNLPWDLRLDAATNTSADMTVVGATFTVGGLCQFRGNIPFRYTEGGLIVIGTNTLSSICGSGRLTAGSQFNLNPAQDITV